MTSTIGDISPASIIRVTCKQARQRLDYSKLKLIVMPTTSHQNEVPMRHRFLSHNILA